MIFDRNKRVWKGLAVLLLINLVAEIVLPVGAIAQGGPAQSESSGFTHLSAGEYVNNFTGDFSYNIPVMNIDGFPIILTYNSNVSMNDEASWVGLGWDLNPGSISRQMRGIPDEFNGEDKIHRSFHSKPDITVGKKKGAELDAGIGIPLGGPFGLGLGTSLSFMKGKYYNNYRGQGKTVDLGLGFSAGLSASFGLPGMLNGGIGINGALGFSFDNQNGIGVNPSIGSGISGTLLGSVAGYSSGVSTNINTREGKKSSTYYSSVTLGNIITTNTVSKGSIKTFGTQTFVPRLNYDSYSVASSIRKGGGLYVNVLLANATRNGVKEFYSNASVFFETEKDIPGYGYNNLEQAENDPSGMMDFNREKERIFSKDMETLPFTNITYDLYQVNTPGVSSMFRAYRNDVGTLTDADVKGISGHFSKSTSKSFGVFYKSVKEFGAGLGNSISGEWNDSNGATDKLEFVNKTLDVEGSEKIHYKVVGEKTPTNEELYNAYGGSEEMYLGLYYDATDKAINTTGILHSDAGTTNIPTTNYKESREIRATAINYYLNHELAFLGQDEIRDYDLLNESAPGSHNYNVVNDSYRSEHHTGKMEVTTGNGAVYGYGLPAYSISESDAVFSVEPGTSDINATNGMVAYEHTGNADNSINNIKGRDNYYEKTTTPAYPTAYLLTDVRSSDYTDKTGDGLTPDDMGTYIKFNYSRVYGGNNPFKWRFPVSEKSAAASGYPEAMYHEGYNTDLLDDKAFYNYGEKEVWYPHSIETKKYVLEFYLEDRIDGYPVLDENGQLNLSAPSKLLKKMSLFSKEDLAQNGANATPLQSVEFEYNYSLCKNYPCNSNTFNDIETESGKLTLIGLRFTSGNSKVGYKSPYVFSYGSGTENPDFNYQNIDRWSNYKPNNSTLNNKNFPYSSQDATSADNQIQSWKLKQIEFPTGGGMMVDYEADNYAYVQDKEVMRHYKMLGVSSFTHLLELNYDAPVDNYSTSPMNLAVAFRGTNKRKPHQVVYFELDAPIVGTRAQADEILIEKYFTYIKDGQPVVMDELYYRTSVRIEEEDEVTEYIPGFAGIKSHVDKSDKEYKSDNIEIENISNGNFNSINGIGVVGGDFGAYHYGYIILETAGIKDKLVNGDFVSMGYPVQPMQKNAWNFTRLNIPWKIYAKCEDTSGDPSIDDCEYDLGADWKTIFTGNINKVLNNNNYCRYFEPATSTIRLMDSRSYKYGGNGRVKSIKYYDNWDQMSGELEASYTLEYDYTNPETGLTSGVAAYEPIGGGDENPFFQPSYFDIDNRLKPDERHYQIDPVGESVFPAPVVGYSTVSIKFSDIANLTRNATGKTTMHYHTAKDFPVSVQKTGIKTCHTDNMLQDDILNYQVFGVTQGFSVQLNDMHGQIKEVEVVDAYGFPVSKTKYKYYDFDEKQPVVNEAGDIYQAWLGKEFDIYCDKRFTKQLNTDVVLSTTKEFALLPIPKINHSTFIMKMLRAFYVATFNKVINHTAVLKEVQTTYLGQNNTQTVLAYDENSGAPISTMSGNEFGLPDYTVSYPAYWRYPEMQPRFQNQRFAWTGLNIDSNGDLNGLTNVGKWFSRGDLVLITDASLNENLAYVIELDESTNKVSLINPDGTEFSATSNVSVLNLQSGFKNRLGESMANYLVKENPIYTSYPTVLRTKVTIDEADVIAGSASEFIENAAYVCEEEFVCSESENPNWSCADDPSNPIKLGVIGNWKMAKSYAFQGNRINGDAASETDIKTDGRIENFVNFFAYGGGKWNTIVESDHPDFISTSNYQNWRLLEQISQFDRFGNPIEIRSQLGIYSSVLYGYNNNFKLLPVAQATNAKVSQIAYDGFEDYFYQSGEINCAKTGHFDFKENVPLGNIVNSEHHTGNFALKIEPNTSYFTTRKISADCGINCSCEKRFSPEPGKYVVGLWVKQDNSPEVTNYSDAAVKIEILENTGFITYTATFTPSGPVVEGWQRVEGVFTIPPPKIGVTEYCIKVSLLNNGDKLMYYDDLRIHPFLSSMSTAVYDSELLLPMAQLDAYNYATIYMYDENLQNVRVRQETERGIYTLGETATGIKK